MNSGDSMREFVARLLNRQKTITIYKKVAAPFHVTNMSHYMPYAEAFVYHKISLYASFIIYSSTSTITQWTLSVWSGLALIFMLFLCDICELGALHTYIASLAFLPR